MKNIELKLTGTLRSAGKDSICLTFPIEVVRNMNLSVGQSVVMEVGEDRDRCGILIVPIREEPQP